MPGSGLGGGGVATAILRLASESNASAKAVMMKVSIPVKKLPITCDNYTYAQARAVLEAGNPLTAMILMSENNMPGWSSCFQIVLSDNCIAMTFLIGDGLTIYWNADGFFDRKPKNSNP